ncbi:hypothetical protein AR543_14065 [Paenibacillus bovis]|uniref:Uncharacterized protein n=1 Tax=Paenibacillus bovis TaxID=1616788 RepID=A0A172ZHF3_9BACL|nr:hypothetical protein AR543_14065 [Paenibacillus bovis]
MHLIFLNIFKTYYVSKSNIEDIKQLAKIILFLIDGINIVVNGFYRFPPDTLCAIAFQDRFFAWMYQFTSFIKVMTVSLTYSGTSTLILVTLSTGEKYFESIILPEYNAAIEF